MLHGTNRQWHIALHMHRDIALNGFKCLVNESTLCLVFDWVDSINGTTSNIITRLIKIVKKIYVGYQQEGIDPTSGEKSANYGQT